MSSIRGMTANEWMKSMKVYADKFGITSNKQFMKIEVEKYYKTRGGHKVRIYATDGDIDLPIHGAILIDGSWKSFSWTADGRLSVPFYDRERDLIAEWTEPLDFDPSCLPAWAGWIAMMSHGVWVWSVKEFVIVGCDWDCLTNEDVGDIGYIPHKYAPKNYTGDWKDSLRKVSDL